MIDIDLSQLEGIGQILEGLFSPQMTEAVLDDLAAAARAKWVRLAQMAFHSTQRAYIDGIQEIESNPGERVITLVGMLPNSLENGMASFDLRDTLLMSEKARMSADGFVYMAIPFRHATPGGGARQAGMPMGERMGPQGDLSRGHIGGLSSGAAKMLGKALYERAKQLGRRTAFGPGMSHTEKRLPAGLAPKLAEHHKTDIYAGMIRQAAHPTGRGSTYTTFRTISERNPEGWIHPGLEPRHLADQVNDYVEDLIPRVVQSTLAGLEVA